MIQSFEFTKAFIEVTAKLAQAGAGQAGEPIPEWVLNAAMLAYVSGVADGSGDPLHEMGVQIAAAVVSNGGSLMEE